jgi:hypothetical protein
MTQTVKIGLMVFALSALKDHTWQKTDVVSQSTPNAKNLTRLLLAAHSATKVSGYNSKDASRTRNS